MRRYAQFKDGVIECRTMAGAVLRSNAGIDPERWGDDFVMAYSLMNFQHVDERRSFATEWFRMAIEAGRRDGELSQ